MNEGTDQNVGGWTTRRLCREDTYRTVSAADNAVMLIDSAKGLEPQTRKLFEVCRLNGQGLLTYAGRCIVGACRRRRLLL